MKGQRLQAYFVKKREIEQTKIQQTKDVQKYYDQWGRITARHEHWSTPSYYQEAGEKMRKRLEEEEKQKKLIERQERLKVLLAKEASQFDNEMQNNKRPRSRQMSIDMLESVRQTLSNAEQCRKRTDLESKLYSRWRLGMDQENILKESKSNHQAMAKLSWLDRQLENQMLNERQRQENNALELKLQEEQRKHEAFIQNCSQQRESEINQIKTLQENHIQELKLRDRESHDIKLLESTLRKKLGEIQKEIENINSVNNKRRDRVHALHNYRKVKMIMRERSEAIRRDLQQDLNLLDRISFDNDFDNNEEINYLRLKFQGQYDLETQNIQSIESMYESEARESLRKHEDKWNEDAMIRERQLKVLMEDRIQTISDKINECDKRQKDLHILRETHLNAIEDCNQRLKELMNTSLINGLNDITTQPNITSAYDKNLNKVIRKTDNLAIDGTKHELALPKFGRKKVAWT
ncbi:CLUMA_CG014422, isoform A [Clunio marinus]|uniref:CLUMA_CG014422, isoform A n=1 Tax=Clunio marinus TaxID=568069 RepID=A0A1J1IR16_9DIPT|nr:CLUMA_CG014422, isoform A [Clunio marinus]